MNYFTSEILENIINSTELTAEKLGKLFMGNRQIWNEFSVLHLHLSRQCGKTHAILKYMVGSDEPILMVIRNNRLLKDTQIGLNNDNLIITWDQFVNARHMEPGLFHKITSGFYHKIFFDEIPLDETIVNLISDNFDRDPHLGEQLISIGTFLPNNK